MAEYVPACADAPWFTIRSVLVRPYVPPGWNRRGRDGRLRPISGWRLVMHRIIWGFNRLTYTAPVWSPFNSDGTMRKDLGFQPFGTLLDA